MNYYLNYEECHQIDQINDIDNQFLDGTGSEIISSKTIGEYELLLVYIQGFYSVSISRNNLPFTLPQYQNVNINEKPKNLPIKEFLETLQEWCDRFDELVIGSYNDKKLQNYINIIKRSDLFYVEDFVEGYVIKIKSK